MMLGHSLGSKFCLFINQQESVWATSGQSSIQNSQNSKITTHMTIVFGCYVTTEAKTYFTLELYWKVSCLLRMLQYCVVFFHLPLDVDVRTPNKIVRG